MALKRFICSCGIILILSMSFITGYTRSGNFVYADSTTDQWNNVTTNEELAEAFRYYCKSRDLTIEGSVADALTSFTTKTFNGLCNTLGIDVTVLQAQIKYHTDGNTGTRFLFSALGIDAYNRIFSQFLQDNELEVGDNVDNKVLYSGYYYNGHLVFIIDTSAGNDKILRFGTSYIGLDGYTVYGQAPRTYNVDPFNTGSVTFSSDKTTNDYYTTSRIGSYALYQEYIRENQPHYVSAYGWVCYYAFENTSNNSLYFGTVSYTYGSSGKILETYYQPLKELSHGKNESLNVNVYITTNNNVINNNTYEGDTIINNEGDVINNNGDDDTPNYNPYPDGGGTTTPSGNTGGGSGADDTDVTFPHFNFQLPEINWSLGDLSEKFPFSIPFDLISFFTVLNAEPRAPVIDSDIPLGSWYTWHFAADFSQFDNYAVIIRNVEFIGFCVGLIYLTIKLVKG